MTPDKRPKMVPSTVLVGASTYQVSAARAMFARETSKTGKQREVSEVKKRVTQPLAENHHVNMSID
ncbi:hypothetical protein TSMEX_005719 [Taenia solium]|eukprot:TsM_001093400 transcript=TsM_001093400 gene=TsM_001093400